MAIINPKDKEVQVKIVYYGPGRCGKTSNLDYIYNKYKDQIKTKMGIIDTFNDNTIFFDFLPLDIGKIMGYQVKIQFYTIPGQVRYNSTRKLVLKGVDGVVFVSDSLVVRREKNLLSFESLKENLGRYDKDISTIPLVFQYNKRDLGEKDIPLLSIETLEKDLNSRLKAPFFEASALTGANIIPTMKKIISSTILSLRKELE